MKNVQTVFWCTGRSGIGKSKTGQTVSNVRCRWSDVVRRGFILEVVLGSKPGEDTRSSELWSQANSHPSGSSQKRGHTVVGALVTGKQSSIRLFSKKNVYVPNAAVRVDVGVEHFRFELHNRGFVRVVLGKGQRQFERPALPRRVFWPENYRVPKHDVRLRRGSRNPGGRILWMEKILGQSRVDEYRVYCMGKQCVCDVFVRAASTGKRY